MSLIYDVGMHNGDDTGFYLNQGHSVVAIEAVPELVEAARLRFGAFIQSGRLTILSTAISDVSGDGDFWVCDELTTWSSLDRRLAARDGKKHHSIAVRCRRFRDVLAESGSPYYAKIDIEGADRLCLNDIDPKNAPRFISVETECGTDEAPLTEEEYLSNLRSLRALGYDCFKLVNQHSLVPVWSSNLGSVFDPHYRQKMRAKIEREANWQFPDGSSGPWGNDIPGPWMSYAEALDVYCECRRMLAFNRSAASFWYWFDWHATRP